MDSPGLGYQKGDGYTSVAGASPAGGCEEKGLHFSEMYGLEVMKPRLDGIFLFLVFSFEILFLRPLLTCPYSWLEEMETKIMDGKLPWSLSGKEYAC